MAKKKKSVVGQKAQLTGSDGRISSYDFVEPEEACYFEAKPKPVQVTPRRDVFIVLLLMMLGIFCLGVAAGSMLEDRAGYHEGVNEGYRAGNVYGFESGFYAARESAKIDLSNTICSEGMSDKFVGLQTQSGKRYWSKCDYFFAENSTPEGFWQDFEVGNRTLPDGAVK